MKTNIRFTDPHKGWLPKADMVHLLPNPLNKTKPHPLVSKGELVDGGKQSEALAASEQVMDAHTKHGGKPHPWDERRTEVMEEFAGRIIERVTPKGFTEAWRPDDPNVKGDEMAWLIATQDMELPPEWMGMRSNGVRGESLDRLLGTEGEDYTLADLVPESKFTEMQDYIDGYELLGGMRRIEAFLKQDDEVKWFASHPHRYYAVVNDMGKRGIVPKYRALKQEAIERDWAHIKQHMDAPEDILAAMEYRAQQAEQTRMPDGRTVMRYKPGTFKPRESTSAKNLYNVLDEFDTDREPLYVDERVEEEPYLPSTPCPNPKCEVRGDDCALCYGSKHILHTLGIDKDLDWPPPGWVDEDANIVRMNKSLRQSIKRLDDDIRDIARFTRKETQDSRPVEAGSNEVQEQPEQATGASHQKES